MNPNYDDIFPKKEIPRFFNIKKKTSLGDVIIDMERKDVDNIQSFKKMSYDGVNEFLIKIRDSRASYHFKLTDEEINSNDLNVVKLNDYYDQYREELDKINESVKNVNIFAGIKKVVKKAAPYVLTAVMLGTICYSITKSIEGEGEYLESRAETYFEQVNGWRAERHLGPIQDTGRSK
jgi:hypothetical protein